jgi:hypothetical protein
MVLKLAFGMIRFAALVWFVIVWYVVLWLYELKKKNCKFICGKQWMRPQMHRIICSVSRCKRIGSFVVGCVSRNSFSVCNVNLNWWFQNTVLGPVILSILVAYHTLILTMCNITTWISHVHYLSIMEVPVTQNSVCCMVCIVEQSLYDTDAALRDSSVSPLYVWEGSCCSSLHTWVNCCPNLRSFCCGSRIQFMSYKLCIATGGGHVDSFILFVGNMTSSWAREEHNQTI